MKDDNVYCKYCKDTVVATKKKADVDGFDYILTPTKDFADADKCKSCRDEHRERNRS